MAIFCEGRYASEALKAVISGSCRIQFRRSGGLAIPGERGDVEASPGVHSNHLTDAERLADEDLSGEHDAW
jgi:hypothetical protein